MKKILFIAPQPFFEVRGTPIAIKDMLSILAQRYEVDLVSYPFGENYPIKNVRHLRSISFGFNSVNIGPSFKKIILDIGLFSKSLGCLLVKKYDYIHSVEEAAFFGLVFKFLFNTQLVYDMDSIMSEQISNSKYSKLSPIFKWGEKKLIKSSDLILAVSKNFRSFCFEVEENANFVEIFDVPQIEKVPLTKELECLFSSSDKKVLYVGNGEKYQGVDLLEEVAKIMPDVTFFIVGTGRDGKVGNIQYFSKVDMRYVWAMMQLVDVLVAPRLAGTNTPMKVYTYMASGKPIVASDIPAHYVLRGCAILCSPDSGSFVTGIKRALSGDNDEMILKAKHLVDERFSFKELTNRVYSAYSALNFRKIKVVPQSQSME